MRSLPFPLVSTCLERTSASLAVLVALAGCGSTDARSGSAAEGPGSTVIESPAVGQTGQPDPSSSSASPLDARDPSWASLVAATDARQLPPLVDASRSKDVAVRRAAFIGLARLHADAAVVPLVGGLADEDASVRSWAAFGIGALEGDAPPEAIESLLAGFAAEVDPSARASMAWSLARTGDDRVAPALRQTLRESGPERVAACRGLAYRTVSAWDDALLHEVLERTTDPAPDVRAACWHGLSRTPVPDALAADIAHAGISALSDTDPEVRIAALRALGRVAPTALATPTADPADAPDRTEGDVVRAAVLASVSDAEWRVAVQALRALGSVARAQPGVVAEALRAAATRSLPATTPLPSLTGAPTHVLTTALEVARDHGRAEPVYNAALEVFGRLEHLDASPARELGLLHCAAAALVDIGRGWPSRVSTCGRGAVRDVEQHVLEADVLARGDGAESQRLALLRRLARDPAPRVREAAITATHGFSTADAQPLVIAGLRDADLGVVIASLEQVTSRANEARRVRDEAAVLAATTGSPVAATPLLPELWPVLEQLAPRIEAADHLEAWVVFAQAVQVIADPVSTDQGESVRPGQRALADLMATLAGHASLAVRRAALAALRALGERESEPSAEVPSASLSPELLRLDAHLAHVMTDRGEVVIELWPAVAPTTVTRFAELAERHFFDGLTFHRVVPGFVAQGGDPRGDGYGGPDFWQRCEDSPLGYERGVVGMALAGRDTGGSQFFVTTGPAHHLDGRYTPFGRVVSGMEVVDQLQPDDRIVRVTVEAGAPVSSYPASVPSFDLSGPSDE